MRLSNPTVSVNHRLILNLTPHHCQPLLNSVIVLDAAITGNLGEFHRALTMMTTTMEDEDNGVLDDEDEFRPSAAMVPGRNDEDLVRKQFEKDIEDARDFYQSKAFKSEAERKQLMLEFVDARRSGWDETTWDGRNFLHHLAYYDFSRQSFVSLQWLMARAIYRLPSLMGVMDKTKRTPLTVALSLGNESFTRSACKNQTQKTLEHIKTALHSECQEHDNDRDVTCLHSALLCDFAAEKSREEIIGIMCSFVPEEMFTVTDFRGRTPLHLAVEYERCSRSQVGIVTELLKRGGKALDVMITLHGNRALSVYQYHQKSRKQRKAEAGKKEPMLQQKRPTQGVGTNRKDIQAEAKRAAPTKDKGNMGPPPLGRDSAEFAPSSLRRRDSAMQSEPSKVAGPLKSGSMQPGPCSATASGQNNSAFSSALDQASKEAEQDQAANEIGEKLKLIYLRTLRPDRVAHSLHVQDERGAHTVDTLRFTSAYIS